MKCPICGCETSVAPLEKGFGGRNFACECHNCHVCFNVKVKTVAPRSELPMKAYQAGVMDEAKTTLDKGCANVAFSDKEKEEAEDVFVRKQRKYISGQLRRKLVEAYIWAISKPHEMFLLGLEHAKRQGGEDDS